MQRNPDCSEDSPTWHLSFHLCFVLYKPLWEYISSHNFKKKEQAAQHDHSHQYKCSREHGNKVSQISKVLENECFSSALTHKLKMTGLELIQFAQIWNPCEPNAELQSLPAQFPPLKQNREYKLTAHGTLNYPVSNSHWTNTEQISYCTINKINAN